MSGYAANLIRSGARGLTTRRKSYAAATLSTVLRSPRDRQAPAEAPVTGPGELAHTVLADVSHQHLGTSSAAPMRKVEAVRMAAQPLQDAPALPPVQISLPAVQLEPSFNVPPVPQSGTTHPKPALTHLPYATPAATPPTSPKSMIAEKKPSVPGRATDVRGTTPAVAPTPSEEPEIDTSPVQVMLMTPEPARQGFYHGRHIRIEHSSPAPNPTVALLQQRPGPAQPGRPAQSNMKEGASPIARTGKPAAATAPSQDIPRIAASQKNSAAATPAGNREMAGSPVAFSPRQPAGPPVSEHESAFALAPVRRTAPREEKQPEGPRLSIGLLEVQIIQEPSQVPQTKTPSSGLPGEHDDLERSYVRPIG